MKTSLSLALLASSFSLAPAQVRAAEESLSPASAAAAPAAANPPAPATPTAATPAPESEALAVNEPVPEASIGVTATGEEVPPPGPSQEDLDGVRSDLENFKFQWQRERDLHTAQSTRALTIGGVVQARGGATDTAPKDATINNRKATFDLGAAQVFFTGNLYKDYQEGRNLSYNVRFGTSLSGGNAYLNLLDANVTYSLLPTLSPEDSQLTVTLGQQLLPFGLEVPATEELRPVITNAQFTTGANGGLNLARRDLALIVRGDLVPRMDYGYNYRQALIAYAFGILNGVGPNNQDDNTFKDIIGRVAFTVPSDYHSILRQLTFGGTVYYGKQNQRVTDANKVTTLLKKLGRKERYGFDVYYNHHPIGVTYEYVEGRDGVALGKSVQDPQTTVLRSRGHVLTLFYNFGEQFVRGYRNQGRFDDWWPKSYQPFFRADLWNANRSTVGDRVNVYTLGFNIFFAETTKFQLNLNRRDIERGNAINEGFAQLQFGF